jgi:assimilatory nitrate reductase catalytic subunit
LNTPVQTTCAYCGVGCGITIAPDGSLRGDPEHPANFGRLCSKGAALLETLGTEDRLLTPLIEGRRASWDEALDLIAERFLATVRSFGPDSVAFYVSGQLLTEDYYVANKLMKGFIGSANIDTNSRLCMASSVAGHIRAFGEDVVPGCYDDIEETDLAVLVGSNMAWCHPVLYQRLMAAREKRGTKVAVIDPRRTATADSVDLHLPLRAGGDVRLFNGLLAHLADVDAVDADWVAAHVLGSDKAIACARAASSDARSLAGDLDLPPEEIARFFDLFARTERVMTFYSQGVNQSEVGTDKVNAILNCHLATGRIGRPGMGPFSLTGQPNAMGGREVGGLANQLAAHMDFSGENVDRVRRFWNAPDVAARPGLKAVDMFEAVADGRVKAIFIAATNPASSMPDADRVRAALENCPFVVVSDCWPTDTTARANVVLPAAGWAEKDGTVTNSERRISRQRAFRAAPAEARPDWWMFAELGRRMGWPGAFPFTNAASIFREHAALSGFENGGKRVFDIGALCEIDDSEYEVMPPTLWPCPRRRPAPERLFARGGFPTIDDRARMVPTPTREEGPRDEPALRLNTGRVRDQWHTMTRTGRVPRLMAHAPEPLLEIHPDDAATFGLKDACLASVVSQFGRTIMRVHVTERQRRGEVFAPMHWSDVYASAGAVARAVTPRTDPISGQPDLKATPVRLSPLVEQWKGLLLHARVIEPVRHEDVYWTKAPVSTGTSVAMSGWTLLTSVIASENDLRRILQVSPEAELVSFSDARRSSFRYAAFEHDRLEACLLLAPSTESLPAMDSVAPKVGRPIDGEERLRLLCGTDLITDRRLLTKSVCACFAVSEATLVEAIAAGEVRSVVEIGSRFRAGTSCGSCVPELKTLLARTRKLPARDAVE